MSENIPASTGAEATPPATPAATEKKDVTLSHEAHEALVKKAADVDTARSLQAQADKKAARLEKILNDGKGAGSFIKKTTTPPAGEAPKAGDDDQGIIEDQKAKDGLLALAIDPAFREVLDADSTLRDLFMRNPLAVLPILAPDALDAEDALDLVKEKLNERLTAIKAKNTPPEKKPDTPPTPPAGAGNPTTAELDTKYAEAKKNPNTESALKDMIGIGLKKLKK